MSVCTTHWLPLCATVHEIPNSLPPEQDYGVTPFAASSDRDLIARELDAYNATARAAVAAAAYAHPLLHLRFVDITAISRAHPTLLAKDGTWCILA